ncbi:radical SAM protein [Candidatus Poribacteria bacterium]|nr:radical SAM protein [Candidatus Poribacteria bacterium]
MNLNPNYLNLFNTGELEKRASELDKILYSCTLCPRQCKVNRMKEEKGYCKAGSKLKIASYNVHNGEEPPISGTHGSGTIFLTGCTMRCVFCQNFPISQLYNGNEYEPKDMANMMLELQSQGCHNINFVTPTHFVPQIVSALVLAVKNGFKIPLVYNTSGYDNVSTLKLLDGIIDIYLPDIKYTNDFIAFKYSNVKNYCESNIKAIFEMHRQVSNLVMDENDIAIRGLIIRHLVLPNKLSNSCDVLHFIAKNISPNVHLSIMSQYFPAHHANDFSDINRRITDEEYEEVLEAMENEKLDNGWIQPLKKTF